LLQKKEVFLDNFVNRRAFFFALRFLLFFQKNEIQNARALRTKSARKQIGVFKTFKN